MPRTGLKNTFKLMTRNQYTTVDCEIGMTVDGKELPNMATLGKVFEEAIELIQERITESYKVVPPRADAAPLAATNENASTEQTERPVKEMPFR